eukprot:COSAG01_NODE_6393_length_3695_cov_7.934112_4_plen_75_part_00
MAESRQTNRQQTAGCCLAVAGQQQQQTADRVTDSQQQIDHGWPRPPRPMQAGCPHTLLWVLISESILRSFHNVN